MSSGSARPGTDWWAITLPGETPRGVLIETTLSIAWRSLQWSLGHGLPAGLRRARKAAQAMDGV